ncbi:MAG: outer membrane beta-barrel protein [Bacteroidota bacterium]
MKSLSSFTLTVGIWMILASASNLVYAQSPRFLAGGNLSAGYDWQGDATSSLYHFSLEAFGGLRLSEKWAIGLSPSVQVHKDEVGIYDENRLTLGLHPWGRYYTGADSSRIRWFVEAGAGVLWQQGTLTLKPDWQNNITSELGSLDEEFSGVNAFAAGKIGLNYRLGKNLMLEPALTGRIDRLISGERPPGGIDNLRFSVGLVYLWGKK